MSCCREIAAEEIKMQSCDCLAISSAPNTPILFAIRRIHLFGCAGSFHRWRGPPSSQRKAWRTKRIPRLPPARSEKKETVFIPGCTPPPKCGRHVLLASLIEGGGCRRQTEGVRLFLLAERKCHIAVKSRPKKSKCNLVIALLYPPPQIHRYSLRSAGCIRRTPSVTASRATSPGGGGSENGACSKASSGEVGEKREPFLLPGCTPPPECRRRFSLPPSMVEARKTKRGRHAKAAGRLHGHARYASATTGEMPAILPPCNREDGDIRAPVAMNSTRRNSPRRICGRKCAASTEAEQPHPEAPA